MGRGNWIPSTPIYQGDYNLAYVEIMDLDSDCDASDLMEMAYDDFLFAVEKSLPASFSKHVRYFQGDTFSIFANNLLLIVMDNKADFWHQGIAVVAQENAPAFAQAQIDIVAKKLWKGLAERGYKLRKRDTAWTSVEFQPA